MIVNAQVMIDKLDGSKFTKNELLLINTNLNLFCSAVEKTGYVSAELYIDNKQVGYGDLEEYSETASEETR